MSRNLEIEVKGLLSKEEYEKIIHGFPNENPYVQINYYIDTKDFEIKSNKCGLRIRFKDDKYELTLKITQEEGKLEINQDLTKKDYELFGNCGVFPSGEVKDYIEQILHVDISKLFIFTSMETTRLDVPFEGSLISIDKSICLGEIDYEIECESISLEKAQNDIEKFLKIYNLKYIKFASSKLKRAMEIYLKDRR